MSISGIAISIGILVDGAIVEVENAYKKLQLWVEGGRKATSTRSASRPCRKSVRPCSFPSSFIAVAFMPIFTLTEQEGRLFKPLAYTKNFAMAIAAFLAVTFDPAIRMMFSAWTISNSSRRGWPGSSTR